MNEYDVAGGSGNSATVTLLEWVQRRFPAAGVVTASEPEPVLLEHNAVAVSRDPEVARSVVLAWERILSPDGAVGFLALGTPPEHSEKVVKPNSDGVMGHAIGQAARGGLPGALVGAVLVTAVVWVIVGWTPILVGAFLGGAILGMVVGMMAKIVKGTGWGAAYIDSFVDDEQTEILLASIHAADDEPIQRAVEAASDIESIELYFVDRAGDTSRAR